MKNILLALALLLFPLSARAQVVYQKPAGALTVVVPNYNVTVGVWAIVDFVGGYLGVFEQQPNGTWIASGAGAAQFADSNFSADVAQMGATAWIIQNGIPGVNATLAQRFPPIISPPPTDAVTQVNTALGVGFQLVTSPATGNEVLAPK